MLGVLGCRETVEYPTGVGNELTRDMYRLLPLMQRCVWSMYVRVDICSCTKLSLPGIVCVWWCMVVFSMCRNGFFPAINVMRLCL